jgi:hypothetical protein
MWVPLSQLLAEPNVDVGAVAVAVTASSIARTLAPMADLIDSGTAHAATGQLAAAPVGSAGIDGIMVGPADLAMAFGPDRNADLPAWSSDGHRQHPTAAAKAFGSIEILPGAITFTVIPCGNRDRAPRSSRNSETAAGPELNGCGQLAGGRTELLVEWAFTQQAAAQMMRGRAAGGRGEADGNHLIERQRRVGVVIPPRRACRDGAGVAPVVPGVRRSVRSPSPTQPAPRLGTSCRRVPYADGVRFHGIMVVPGTVVLVK